MGCENFPLDAVLQEITVETQEVQSAPNCPESPIGPLPIPVAIRVRISDLAQPTSKTQEGGIADVEMAPSAGETNASVCGINFFRKSQPVVD